MIFRCVSEGLFLMENAIKPVLSIWKRSKRIFNGQERFPIYRLTNEELSNVQGIYDEIICPMTKYIPEMTFIEWEPVH